MVVGGTQKPHVEGRFEKSHLAIVRNSGSAQMVGGEPVGLQSGAGGTPSR